MVGDIGFRASGTFPHAVMDTPLQLIDGDCRLSSATSGEERGGGCWWRGGPGARMDAGGWLGLLLRNGNMRFEFRGVLP